MSNGKKILLIFACLLGMSLIYAYLNWPRQARVTDTPPVQPRAQVSFPAGEGSPPGDGSPVEAPDGEVRNIFAPLFPAVVRPAASAVGKPRSVKPSMPAVAPPLAPAVPTIPRPVFLGKLKHGGGKSVFLSVLGEVYIVKPGERFGPDMKYTLVEVGNQSLTIRHEEESAGYEIAAEEPPVSVLEPTGGKYRPGFEPLKPVQSFVPPEPQVMEQEGPAGAAGMEKEGPMEPEVLEKEVSTGGDASDKEVPIDENIDE